MSRFPLHLHSPVSALALYGAVLSTVTALVQVMNHYRDRANVVVKIRKNMKSSGSLRYGDMTLVIVTATNIGRRPITITGFAAKLLHGKQKHTDWLLTDVRPPLPYEITEGREVSAFVDQSNVDFDIIASWYAWDTTGRYFRLNVAPWYKRWLSRWRSGLRPVTEKKSL